MSHENFTLADSGCLPSWSCRGEQGSRSGKGGDGTRHSYSFYFCSTTSCAHHEEGGTALPDVRGPVGARPPGWADGSLHPVRRRISLADAGRQQDLLAQSGRRGAGCWILHRDGGGGIPIAGDRQLRSLQSQRSGDLHRTGPVGFGRRRGRVGRRPAIAARREGGERSCPRVLCGRSRSW